MKHGLLVSYIAVVFKIGAKQLVLLLLSGVRWSPRLQAAIATAIIERVEGG